MAFSILNFESQYLHGNTPVGIVLPNKPRDTDPKTFYDPGKKYKVLWLLHGGLGDFSDWMRKSMIELYACEHDLIVVMPSAMNSNYLNWSAFSDGYLWNDYFFQELMPLAYAWLPASDRREDNFIAGASMGGEGALHLMLKHPERFGAAAVFSSSGRNFSEWMPMCERVGGRKRLKLHNFIANAGGEAEFISSDLNIRNTLQKMAEGQELDKLPRLYFSCGEADVNHDFAAHMQFNEFCRKLGVRFTSESVPGYTHEWRFWDKQIERAIHFFLQEEQAVK